MSYEDISSSHNDNAERRYCICQKLEEELNGQDDNDDFMIECDGCNGWFHGRCVSLADRIADDIEKYFCIECSKNYGPSIFKPRQNQHRRDYSDADAENKPIQSGTKAFINQLKRKTFLDCEPVIIRVKGDQLTCEYLLKNGFTKPILISNRDGLDLTLPHRTITLEEINRLIGHDQLVDIIDCEKQVIYKMSFKDYVEYFESYDRNKIYNVLSLEVSNTKLGEYVITPRIVRDLSWATTGIWPNKKKTNGIKDTKNKQIGSLDSSLSKLKHRVISSSTDTDRSGDDDEDFKQNHFENFDRPEVAKYCLISPQSSYTDFHIDFGGSSVWYSIVRGEKIFYLIEPTDENLQKYADWSNSPTESETFLGDCVSRCYKMHIREGNTILLPPGWIHAVYTVTDSLVFGGNFLQSMGVDMQLRLADIKRAIHRNIYELERHAKVAQKFKYPLFETHHWYAAKHFYNELRECNQSNSSKISPILQQASESILYHMSRWLTSDKRYQIRNRYIIPRGMNCEKLLRDISHELDIAKSRCGLSNHSKLHSNTAIINSNKIGLPTHHKKDFVQIGENKIKVKCRRLSGNDKHKGSIVGHEVKLTIKSKIDENRKSNHNGSLLGKIQKKKFGKQLLSKKHSSRPENSSRISYKLDLKAKRQNFTPDSRVQSFKNENESKTSMKTSIHDIETHKNNSGLFDINSGGLTSFVARSNIDKGLEIKQEHLSFKQKFSSLKKAKFQSSDIDKKFTKKIKVEFKKSTNGSHPSDIIPSTLSQSSLLTKKPLLPSTPIPKKVNSTDHLGKIVKISESIKSRGGILT